MDPRIEIIEENESWLALNKPGGLVCHPTKGDAYSSLIGRLRLYFEGQTHISPSFVNRLDRETSGVILIAKNPATHASLQRAFENRLVQKSYLAIVAGAPEEESGSIDQPLGKEPGSEVVIKQCVLPGGAASRTNWNLLKKSDKFSLLAVRPESGRLHQIRVHLASIGLPIVGDKIYGSDPKWYLEFVKNGWIDAMQEPLRTQRQMLHAIRLEIDLPDGKKVWEAPVPLDMANFLDEHFKSL